MMQRLSVLVLSFFGLSLLLSTSACAGFGDFLKEIQRSMGVGQGLSEDKIVDGLKEALEVGASNAVSRVSRLGGYYDNPKIRIPLPAPVKKVEGVLRTLGYGSEIDDFELSMNRAAEKAAPEAKALFWNAIKQMTFEDARKILKGRDNEATLYFEDKTRHRLADVFKPIVDQSMSQVGATRFYQDLDAKASGIPFVQSFRFDLDQYVTDLALDGLFVILSEEERKIREDPGARVTDLLKEVFGSATSE